LRSPGESAGALWWLNCGPHPAACRHDSSERLRPLPWVGPLDDNARAGDTTKPCFAHAHEIHIGEQIRFASVTSRVAVPSFGIEVNQELERRDAQIDALGTMPRYVHHDIHLNFERGRRLKQLRNFKLEA
jgi:hypothetical protein